MIMPFGKYKGQDIMDIPLDYLEWAEFTCELELYDSNGSNLRDEVNFEISRRGRNIIREESKMKRLMVPLLLLAMLAIARILHC